MGKMQYSESFTHFELKALIFTDTFSILISFHLLREWVTDFDKRSKAFSFKIKLLIFMIFPLYNLLKLSGEYCCWSLFKG